MFYDDYYFLAWAGDFLFSITVKTGFGALPASRSAGTFVKRPGRRVYHSPPSSAEVKNEWRPTFIAWTGTAVHFIVCRFSSFPLPFGPVTA